jgi:hypothetical protein
MAAEERSFMERRQVILANPDSKRWHLYHRELEAFWADRGVSADFELVPWHTIVPRDGSLDGLTAFARPALVRLESPGRDYAVARLLLDAGRRDYPHRPDDWNALPDQKGRLLHPGLLYLGFRRVLAGLRMAFDRRPYLRPLACPLAIADMFDKTATTARLVAAGLPCPPSLPVPATSGELLDLLRREHVRTAYVKLNTGSSASGIAVVHALDDPPWALTTAVQRDGVFFSTRRPRRYQGGDLHSVLSFLLAEGACVQHGIRIAQIDGQNFDVRVIVIAGVPAFTVFRLSNQPMTNLHLGGRRGDPARCRAAIPTRAWLDALDHCVEAARLYDAVMVGIDLLFESGFLRHYLLEVNAFGDFFPGLTDARGRTVHRVEIEALT